ncbi:MAG: nucleotidyltransferase domain-containing protein [Candidatus Uhrbacteria bacterium]
MRVCYPWSYIPDRVPMIADFFELRETIMELLEEYSTCIRVAHLWGSALGNTLTRRSDIDLIIVHHAPQRRRAQQLLAAIHNAAERHHIFLDAHLIADDLALSGHHGLPLTNAPDITALEICHHENETKPYKIGKEYINELIVFLGYTKERVQSEARAYFPRMRQFNERLRLEFNQFRQWPGRKPESFDLWLEQLILQGWSQPFEQGTMTVRKLFTWRDGYLPAMNTDNVISRFLRDDDFAFAHGPVGSLVHDNARYDHLLTTTLEGLVSKDRYNCDLMWLLGSVLSATKRLLDSVDAYFTGTLP